MKLAEALIKRADLKARIAQIISRMTENALVQEGDAPDEDMTELQALYDFSMKEMEQLIIRINKTNNETMLGDVSVAAAIAKRDCLKAKIAAYRSLKEAATKKPSRFDRYESNVNVKYVRTVDIAELQKTMDDLSRQFRELDTKIQGCNWNSDLL